MAVTGAVNDDLLGRSLLGLLRLGNGEWNLALFLLRPLIRDGSRFLRLEAPAPARSPGAQFRQWRRLLSCIQGRSGTPDVSRVSAAEYLASVFMARMIFTSGRGAHRTGIKESR